MVRVCDDTSLRDGTVFDIAGRTPESFCAGNYLRMIIPQRTIQLRWPGNGLATNAIGSQSWSASRAVASILALTTIERMPRGLVDLAGSLGATSSVCKT
jgi:hypothetical protein